MVHRSMEIYSRSLSNIVEYTVRTLEKQHDTRSAQSWHDRSSFFQQTICIGGIDAGHTGHSPILGYMCVCVCVCLHTSRLVIMARVERVKVVSFSPTARNEMPPARGARLPQSFKRRTSSTVGH